MLEVVRRLEQIVPCLLPNHFTEKDGSYAWAELIHEKGEFFASSDWKEPSHKSGHATYLGVTPGGTSGYFNVTLYNLGMGIAPNFMDNVKAPCAVSLSLSTKDANAVLRSFAVLGEGNVSEQVANYFLTGFSTGEVPILVDDDTGVAKSNLNTDSVPTDLTIIKHAPHYPMGSAVLADIQTCGNCTAASLEALVRHLVVELGIKAGYNAAENENLINLIFLFVRMQILNKTLMDLQGHNADPSYAACAQAVNLEFRTLEQQFNALKHLIRDGEILRDYEAKLCKIREEVIAVLQNIVYEGRVISADRSKAIAPSEILPCIPEVADATAAGVALAKSSVSDFCEYIDAARSALSKADVDPEECWLRVGDVLRKFSTGVPSFGGEGQDRVAADALKFVLLHPRLPLEAFTGMLNTKNYANENELWNYLEQIVHVSTFFSRNLQPDVRNGSPEDENLFLTLQFMCVATFRQMSENRQAAICRRLGGRYDPFVSGCLAVKVPPIDPNRDYVVLPEVDRRRAELKLLCSSTSETSEAVYLNDKMTSDAVTSALKPIEKSVESILNGDGNCFTQYSTAVDEALQALTAADKTQEKILSEMFTRRQLVQRAREKENKIQALKALASECETEIKNVTDKKTRSESSLDDLKAAIDDAETKYKNAKTKREQYETGGYKSAHDEVVQAERALSDFERDVTALNDLRSKSKQLFENVQKIDVEISRLDALISDTTKKLPGAQKNLEYKKEIAAAAETTLKKAETNYAAAKENADKSTGDVLRKAADDAKERLEGAQKKFNDCNSDAQKADTEVKELQDKLNQLNQKLEGEKNHKTAAENQVKTTQDEIAALVKRLDIANENDDAGIGKRRNALTDKMNASKGKYNEAITTLGKFRENEQKLKQEYDTAVGDLRNMNEFIATLQARIDQLSELTKRINGEVIPKIRKWDDPASNAVTQAMGELAKLRSDYVMLARQKFLFMAMIGEYMPGSGGSTFSAMNAGSNACGSLVDGLAARVRRRTDADRNKEKINCATLHDAVNSALSDGVFDRIYSFDELNSITSDNSVFIAAGKFSYTSEISKKWFPEEDYDAFKKLPPCPKDLRNKSSIEAQDHASMQRVIDELTKFDLNDTGKPHDTGPILTEIFGEGAIPTVSGVRANQQLAEHFKTFRKNADAVTCNFALGYGLTKGNPGSIAQTLLSAPGSQYGAVYTPSVGPMNVTGLGDFAKWVHILSGINVDICNGRNNFTLKSDPDNAIGAGFPEQACSNSPQDALTKGVSPLKFNRPFDDRSGDFHIQDDTKSGRLAHNEKLASLDTDDFLAKIKKVCVLDKKCPQLSIISILSVIESNIHLLAQKQDSGKADVTKILQIVANDACAQRCANMSPDGSKSVLRQLVQLFETLRKSATTQEVNNPLVQEYNIQMVELFNNLFPVLSAVMEMCAKPALADPDSEEDAIKILLEMQRSMLNVLKSNTRNDALTTKGNAAIAKMMVLVGDVCIRHMDEARVERAPDDANKIFALTLTGITLLNGDASRSFRESLDVGGSVDKICNEHIKHAIELLRHFLARATAEGKKRAQHAKWVMYTTMLFVQTILEDPAIDGPAFKRRAETRSNSPEFPSAPLVDVVYDSSESRVACMVNGKLEEFFSFANGLKKDANVSHCSGSLLKVDDVFAGLSGTGRMALKRFFKFADSSQIKVVRDGTQQICELLDGSYAGRCVTVNETPLDASSIVQMDGWTFCETGRDKAVCKILEQGVIWGKKESDGSNVYKVFLDDKSPDWEKPNFKMHTTGESYKILFRDTDGEYREAYISKLSDVGMNVEGLGNLECICIATTHGLPGKIMVPSIIFNGRPLVLEHDSQTSRWCVAGIPGYHVASSDEIRNAGADIKLREPFPLLLASALTLISDNIQSGSKNVPLRHLVVPCLEQNVKDYKFDDCTPDRPIPERKDMSGFKAFDAASLKTAHNAYKQRQLFAFTSQDGSISLADSEGAIDAILQRIVGIHTLLLCRKYDQAMALLRGLRQEAVLPSGEMGDTVRRVFAEAILSVRDMSPTAMAIKFVMLEAWHTLDGCGPGVSKYLFQTLPKQKKFQGNSSDVADEECVAICANSFLRGLESNVENAAFISTLAGLAWGKDQAVRTLEKSYELLVNYFHGSSKPEPLDSNAMSHINQWQDRRWLNVVNCLTRSSWPCQPPERQVAPSEASPKNWQGSECATILAAAAKIFGGISTKFGKSAPKKTIEFTAQDLEDAAKQKAYDRMREELDMGKRRMAERDTYVPLNVSTAYGRYKEFADNTQTLYDQMKHKEKLLREEIANTITWTNPCDIDVDAATVVVLTYKPTADGRYYFFPPTKSSGMGFRIPAESFDSFKENCRALACVKMVESKCAEAQKYSQIITSQDSTEADKRIAYENMNRSAAQFEEFCKGTLGYVGEALGKSLPMDAILCFGLEQGIVPTKEQVGILQDLAEGKYVTFKLMMGGGKSSVLAALHSYAQSLNGMLPIIACDKTQFTQAQGFWKPFEKRFGQEVYVMSPSRIQLQNSDFLKGLLDKMRDLRSTQGIFLTETSFFSKLELEIAEVLAAQSTIANLVREAEEIAGEIDSVIRIMRANVANLSEEGPSEDEYMQNARDILMQKSRKLNRIKADIIRLGNTAEYEERFALLIAIKKFLKEYGYANFDEVHLNLSSKQEVNYPSGRQMAIAEDLNNDVASLFKIIAEVDAIDKCKGGLFGFTNNTQAQRTNDDYQRSIEELNRRLLQCKLTTNTSMLDFLNKYDISVQMFFGINSGRLDADGVVRMVQKNGDKNDIIALKRWMTWVDVMKRLETACHNEVNRKMGLTMRTPDGPPVMVPFIASMTPSANDFANLMEKVVNFFIQASVAERGYFEPFVPKLVEIFKDEMAIPIAKEVIAGRTNESGSASKLCVTVLGRSFDEVSIAIRHKDSNPDEYNACMEGIIQHLAKDDSARITLFQIGSKYSNTYNKAMHTDGCNSAVALFDKKIVACSGTISDVNTLPRRIRDGFNPQGGVEGSVLLKLQNDLSAGTSRICVIKNSNDTNERNVSNDGNEPNVEDLFESVPFGRRRDVRVVIDRAGVFKIKKTDEILKQYAAELEKYGSGVEWILFGDATKGFMAFNIKEGGCKCIIGITAADLRGAGIDPDKCAAFLSERLATGTDAQFFPGACGITTVDPGTNTPEELAQAVMRLRQFFAGQHMCLAVVNCKRLRQDFFDLPQEERLVPILELMAQNEGEYNKGAVLQAQINELTSMFKLLVTDAIMRMGYQDAAAVRCAFDRLFTREIIIDMIAQNRYSNKLIPGYEILRAHGDHLIGLFRSIFQSCSSEPWVAPIREAFIEFTRPPREDGDTGGCYYQFLNEAQELLRGLIYPANTGNNATPNAELEQQVEMFMETEVNVLMHTTQQQNQMQDLACQLQAATTNFDCSNVREKVTWDIAGGFTNGEMADKVSPDMFEWTGGDGIPNPGQLIKRLYISRNWYQIMEGQQPKWPFAKAAPARFILVDRQGNACIMDEYDVSPYMQRPWGEGDPVLFDLSTGTAIVGDPQSVPNAQDAINEGLLFAGMFSLISSGWLKERFMPGARDGRFTPEAMAVCVYLIECENKHRRDEGLADMNEDERASIAGLFSKDHTGECDGGEMLPYFSRPTLGIDTAVIAPWDHHSVVAFLTQSDGTNTLTRDNVRSMPGSVLNKLPHDIFVWLCVHFAGQIRTSELNSERLLVYDMLRVGGRQLTDPTEVADQLVNAAKAFNEFSSMNFEQNNPLAYLQEGIGKQMRHAVNVFKCGIMNTMTNAVNMHMFDVSPNLRLCMDEQCVVRERFIDALSEELENYRFDSQSMTMDAAQEIAEQIFNHICADFVPQCPPEQIADATRYMRITIETLWREGLVGELASAIEMDKSIARVRQSFVWTRKVKAFLAWAFVCLLLGFPLFFRYNGSSFDKLLRHPIFKSRELNYLKWRISDLNDPDRCVIISMLEDIVKSIKSNESSTVSVDDTQASPVKFNEIGNLTEKSVAIPTYTNFAQVLTDCETLKESNSLAEYSSKLTGIVNALG
jgi:predicted  nucleic acid-binding Zn-ribbon protein